MIVLAIDTAGTACNVALHDSESGTVLGRAGADIGRGHAERLMGFIDEALDAAVMTLDRVDRIAVTIGPGSFTGIRVGVAAARGLALALGVPAVGVPVLQALAVSALSDAPGRPVLAVIDAKRGEVYLQRFDAGGQPDGEPAALDVAEATRLYGDFEGTVCGSGAVLLAGGAPSGNGDVADIATVARLGAAADARTAPPKPLYLRGPDVRSQAGFAVARA